MTMLKKLFYLLVLVAITATSCKNEDDTPTPMGKDINTAQKASIDRFSANAGTLMVRDGSNGLPEANAPIDFDNPPFITKGLGPDGTMVEYYNFDVQSTTPSPIYVFFKSGASTPVGGQNNIVATIPGDASYNDFWIVNKVTVPDDYVANSLTSQAEVLSSGYDIEVTDIIVNCPVVPFGSTATKKFGGGTSELTLGWYKGMAVAYFSFEEKMLKSTSGGSVPLSPIYVMFNDNAQGPASGFMTEPGTDQTHNVVATIPSDGSYSPLWIVNVVDNADFDNVTDLSSAQSANILDSGVANVNCPIVE